MKQILLLLIIPVCCLYAQPKKKSTQTTTAGSFTKGLLPSDALKTVKFRNIGPFRGGRSVTACGVTLKKSATDVLGRMNTWEDALVQNRSQSYDDIVNFVNKLSADYFFLKGEMDSNIPGVTDGQKEQFQTLDATWKPLKSEYNDIINKSLPELNSLCRSLGIERVMMPID